MAAGTKAGGAQWRNDSRFVLQWTLTDTDATGDWYEISVGADKAIHVVYDSGSGTVTFQGSNEPGTPTGPVTLRNEAQTTLVFTGTDGQLVLGNFLKYRPVLTGAAGGTSIRVLVNVNGS